MRTALASKVGRKPKQEPLPLTENERQQRIWDLRCYLATTKRQLAHAEMQDTCADGVVTPTERVVNLRAERDQLMRRIEELTLDRKYWRIEHD